MTVKPINVLLIEDNPGDVRLIREMLSRSINISFEIEHADRLSTGLERLAQGGIDILLLDLGLPDSRGIESIGKVRASNTDVPIVVLTGLADETIGIKAVHEGAQDYLIKGQVESNLLRRSLSYAIERWKLFHELQDALAKVKTLSGMIPICASCKKIRDDKGYWEEVASYITKHSEALFSHGLCPDCAKKAYEELEKIKNA